MEFLPFVWQIWLHKSSLTVDALPLAFFVNIMSVSQNLILRFCKAIKTRLLTLSWNDAAAGKNILFMFPFYN